MTSPLDLSLGEFEALASKALRGAGHAWGTAADGAHAARVLARYGFAAADIVARLITATDTTSATDTGATTDESVACPITLGGAAADLGGRAAELSSLLDGGLVREPLLLAPFVSDCRLAWSTGCVDVSDTGIAATGQLPEGPTKVRARALGTTGNPTRPTTSVTRAIVSPTTYETLLAFAGRTYAPATEESRSLGAG